MQYMKTDFIIISVLRQISDTCYVNSFHSAKTHPKVRCSKSIRGRNVVGSLGGVGIVGINVGQQGAHYCRYTRAHVLRRQTGKVAENERKTLT